VLNGYTDKNTGAKGRGSDLTHATQTNPIRTRADLGAVLNLLSSETGEKSSDPDEPLEKSINIFGLSAGKAAKVQGLQKKRQFTRKHHL